MPKILNSKCPIAVIRAETVPVKEAKRAVMVVPMFAPNVNGNICLSVRTPAPARGTTREVVMDELCTIIVSSAPNAMDLNTVLNIY